MLFIALIGIILQALFIYYEHREKYKLAVVLKGSASLCFVIIGFLMAKETKEISFANLIKTGLIFGMLGDIFLNLRFVFEKQGQKVFLFGILLFLIGHILYLVAIVPFCEHLVLCIVAGAILAALLLYRIFTTMQVEKAFKIFGIVYLGAVIIMCVIAICNAFTYKSAMMICYGVGALLFTLSDIVLIFNTFGSTTKFSRRILNLSLYYLGQLLIALSIGLF